jgi:hypothetical protein
VRASGGPFRGHRPSGSAQHAPVQGDGRGAPAFLVASGEDRRKLKAKLPRGQTFTGEVGSSIRLSYGRIILSDLRDIMLSATTGLPKL